jgi:hypothetical protein
MIVWVGIPYYGFIVVFLLGALAGAAELVARYPDAPQAAITTGSGLFYTAVNAVAAVATLIVVAILGVDDTAPAITGQAFTTGELLNLIMISGFGSLALLRSKIITLRVGDSDVGVGPSFLLETILRAADRAVDRKRAKPRARIVSEIMSSVSFEEAKVVLPSYCFAVMQNVSVEEQQKVALEIDALTSADMPDRVKALNLGLLLLNIVGEHVLNTAVKNLQAEFAAASGILESVETAMAAVDFEKAVVNLTPLCAEMAEISEEEREQLEFEVQRLRGVTLTERTRKYLYGLLLIRAFGSEIVSRAINAIQSDIFAAEATGPENQAGPAAEASSPRDRRDIPARPPGATDD